MAGRSVRRALRKTISPVIDAVNYEGHSKAIKGDTHLKTGWIAGSMRLTHCKRRPVIAE